MSQLAVEESGYMNQSERMHSQKPSWTLIQDAADGILALTRRNVQGGCEDDGTKDQIKVTFRQNTEYLEPLLLLEFRPGQPR